MKFGIFDQNDASGAAPQDHYARRLEMVELYDRSGFHIYHMSEHHGTALSLTPSPNVFLAAVAQRTRRLRFGPLVYLLPLYNPLRLVEEICLLDGLSGGRFEFGIGRGASPHEIRFMGVDPADAASIYEEVYELVMQGLTVHRLDFKGRHWTFDDVPVAVRPVQLPHPPMWYAAASAETARWPAQNGFNIIAGGPRERVKAVAASCREVWSGSGAAAQSSRLVGLNRYIVVAESNDDAVRIARGAWIKFYESFWRLWADYGGKPANAALPDSIDPLIASGGAVVGTPDRVAELLAEEIAYTGVNFLSGSFVFGDMRHEDAVRSVSLFATQVIPKLAHAGGPVTGPAGPASAPAHGEQA